ncbi:hypothetical protein ACWCQN_44520 [Streptomyces sp. NPDC001984]|uniref:hypothetical protein n=1 Tax=Streptomyces sp. NPDC002619 TaxID=3364655 RepID=UPI0036B447E9
MDGLRLERRDATGLADVRHELLDVYAEIYADRLGEEFHSIERFDERLGWNTEVPGFAAVVGYLDDTPIAYAYGCTLTPDGGTDCSPRCPTVRSSRLAPAHSPCPS